MQITHYLTSFSKMKKIILSVLLLMIFSALVSYVISIYRLKETKSLMQAFGTISSETHMLYCETKPNSIAIKIVVDFDERTIMLNGQYHVIAVNPATKMLYKSTDNFNAMLTKSYVNKIGVPTLIIFTFDKESGKYSMGLINAITSEIQDSYDIACKY